MRRGSASCQCVRQRVNDLSGEGGIGGVGNKRSIMTAKPGCPFSSGNFTVAVSVVNVQ